MATLTDKCLSILRETYTLSELFTPNGQRHEVTNALTETVKNVALLAFNGYAMWCSPTIYTISFIAGLSIFHQEVNKNITSRIGGIYALAMIPLYYALFRVDAAAVMMMQAALCGADLGCRFLSKFGKAH